MSEEQLRVYALQYHEFPTPGKMSIAPTKALANQRDLSLPHRAVAHGVPIDRAFGRPQQVRARCQRAHCRSDQSTGEEETQLLGGRRGGARSATLARNGAERAGKLVARMERVAGAARGRRGGPARQTWAPQTSRARAGPGALRQGQGGVTP